MENEFPANSRSPQRTPPEKSEVKKVEAVVTSGVVRRKKPLGKRLLETFIGGSANSVAHYILMDVLLPAAKDTVADAVSQGVERLIFGEARSSSRRTGYRPGNNNPTSNYTSYNRFSSGGRGPLPGRREDPQPLSDRARSQHDFDEIILASRVEAEEVIDRLFDLISRYEMATLSDLYDLVGQTSKFTDEKWGWTDLRGASITRIRNGYLLDLPRPEILR